MLFTQTAVAHTAPTTTHRDALGAGCHRPRHTGQQRVGPAAPIWRATELNEPSRSAPLGHHAPCAVPAPAARLHIRQRTVHSNPRLPLPRAPDHNAAGCDFQRLGEPEGARGKVDDAVFVAVGGGGHCGLRGTTQGSRLTATAGASSRQACSWRCVCPPWPYLQRLGVICLSIPLGPKLAFDVKHASIRQERNGLVSACGQWRRRWQWQRQRMRMNMQCNQGPAFAAPK